MLFGFRGCVSSDPHELVCLLNIFWFFCIFGRILNVLSKNVEFFPISRVVTSITVRVSVRISLSCFGGGRGGRIDFLEQQFEKRAQSAIFFFERCFQGRMWHEAKIMVEDGSKRSAWPAGEMVPILAHASSTVIFAACHVPLWNNFQTFQNKTKATKSFKASIVRSLRSCRPWGYQRWPWRRWRQYVVDG